MLVALLILSPLAIMWAVAHWCHAPSRQAAQTLVQSLMLPLWHGLVNPVGRQKEAFAQFYVGIAIASSIGAASVAFGTDWSAITWVPYLKLAGLCVGVPLSLILACWHYRNH